MNILQIGLVLLSSLGALMGMIAPGKNNQTALTSPQDAGPTVVINEVAWMGTTASYQDEWLELYNNTPLTVSMEGWALSSNDGMTLALNGSIAPYGYYLIERTNDDTVSDVTADWIGSFGAGLSNGGEVLTLTNASGIVVDTANHGGGAWPAGNNTTKATMERVNPTQPDEAANWTTNDGSVTNGRDADGNAILGTPHAANAAYQSYFRARADLHVTQLAPTNITAGHVLTYVLTLSNRGGATATTVLLTDTLPLSVQFVSQQASFPCTHTGNVLLWRVDDMPPAAHHLFTVTTLVSSTAGSILTNTLSASTPITELYYANNTNVWTTTVTVPQANLVVTQTGSLTAEVATRITYTIHITNTGEADAQNVLLTDTLPLALAFVAQQSGATFAHDGQTLTWNWNRLPSGSAVSATLVTQLSSGISGPVTHTVTVGTATPESTLDDNAASWRTQVGAMKLLIAEVLYKGYQLGDADEAVQLINVGTASGNLSGWELCKDVSGVFNCRPLPDLTVAPQQRVWLARDAAAFKTSFGFAPDATLESWLSGGLSNNGDEVILRTPEHRVADAVVYKGGTAPLAGWPQADTVQPYSVGREDGQILARIPDESSGLPITDTNTAADWLQTTTNAVSGRRVLYPGWSLDPLFWPAEATEQATVEVGIAPDNAFTVISQTLAKAQQSVAIEIYALRHPALIAALTAKARQGVSVTLLLEGGQVGVGANDPRWQTELYACQQIEAAGGACWFMIHEPDDHIYNRYDYIHAKLMIVDHKWAVIGTQNFTNSSMPADDKQNGTYGSRGVVIATDSPSVVARAEQIFALDLAPAQHNDILRWNTGYLEKYGPPTVTPVLTIPDGITYTVHFSTPLNIPGGFHFELFTAPEAALRQSDALLGLVNRAGSGDQVYVEQLYEQQTWGDGPNLRLQAYLDAARRGATVRILLNGGSFGQIAYAQPNTATVAYVNQIARDEHLDLAARLGDPTEYGIHSKMVLVNLHDEGPYIHIGSINGSESSNKVNREIALQIGPAREGTHFIDHGIGAVYATLERLFFTDWWLSQPVYLPCLIRNYTPPEPPVNYVVISEVYYATGDVNREWVEIYNPTSSAIDLSNYKIGDAETPDRYEGMYRFPPGTQIPAQGVLVIAGNGKEVPEANFEFFALSDTPDMIRESDWGTGDWTLRNDGDQVLLLGPDNQPVDVVVWGDAAYPGVIPHPGVGEQYTHSLERYPPYYDHDDCSQDFRNWFPPSPGSVPE